ncbi:MAG: hypothetical protein GX295_03940 [Syntrophomonadaceae bacterium]|nr:hypothetical protein [Syntrophomonadaceae bacterium]
MKSVRDLTELALLAASILVVGSIKLPSLIPGAEFQLSAPLAIAIVVNFGFTRYLTAGVVASLLCLMLGTHNLLNVAVAMIFRVVAGGTVSLLGSRPSVIVLAGPLGSIAARLALSLLVGKAAWALVVAAIPGMIFTALTAYPLTKIIQRVLTQVGGPTVRREAGV